MSSSPRQSAWARALANFTLLLLCAACDAPERILEAPLEDAGSDAEPELSELLDQSAWRNYAPERDPLASHQPEEIDCNIAGWFLERGSLEISTADCNYLLVEQPAQRAVARGSELSIELVHFDLEAPEPATAHVALLFEDEVQWELEVPVPSYAYVYKQTFRATRALAEGEMIRLHLHNHGQNTWLLTSVMAR